MPNTMKVLINFLIITFLGASIALAHNFPTLKYKLMEKIQKTKIKEEITAEEKIKTITAPKVVLGPPAPQKTIVKISKTPTPVHPKIDLRKSRIRKKNHKNKLLSERRRREKARRIKLAKQQHEEFPQLDSEKVREKYKSENYKGVKTHLIINGEAEYIPFE